MSVIFIRERVSKHVKHVDDRIERILGREGVRVIQQVNEARDHADQPD